MYARSGGEEITVLVVEDDIETAALFAEWLEPSYIVKVAYDCVTAYEQFDESIDIALLERQLPVEMRYSVKSVDSDLGSA